MGGLSLVVFDVQSRMLEEFVCAPRKPDTDHRIIASMGDEHTRVLAVSKVRIPAFDRRDESGEGQDPCRRRPVRPKSERVAHHRAHRESSEHYARVVYLVS